MGHAFECEYCESFHYERQRRKKHMKNTITNIIKKGDFVRTTFAPNVFLCIEEEVIDLDTPKETSFWASDEDGGEWEVALEEIEEVISGDRVIDHA